MKFILKDTFFGPLRALSNEELGILFRAVFMKMKGEEVDVPSSLQRAWGFLDAQLEIQQIKLERTAMHRAEAGRKGMASRWGYNKHNNCYKPSDTQKVTKPKKADNKNNICYKPADNQRVTADTGAEQSEYNKNNICYKPADNQKVTAESQPIYNKNNKNNTCYEPAEAQIVTEEIAEEEKNMHISDNNININISSNNITNKEKKEKEKKEKTAKNFKPPTLEEVKAYILERGYKLTDAERFLDFYQSKGWMVGRNKMKDWKAAVRNWEREGKTREKTKGKTGKVYKNDPSKYEDMETW